MKRLLLLLSIFLPWPIRRWLLSVCYGYEIDPTARIGFSWIAPDKLIMEANSRISDLTLVKGLDLLHLKVHASIGRGNWITAFPSSSKEYFSHRLDRDPSLIVGEHAAITSRHLLDCTDRVSVGKFAILGGFRSQLITHSIDFRENRQSCAPISIGDFSFVGTDCVLLGGSTMPDYAILGAKSMLNRSYAETYQLYAGVPARPVKSLDATYKFFSRAEGMVR